MTALSYQQIHALFLALEDPLFSDGEKFYCNSNDHLFTAVTTVRALVRKGYMTFTDRIGFTLPLAVITPLGQEFIYKLTAKRLPLGGGS